MITHILDTSAWLIHIFKEPGSAQITDLFKDGDHRVAVSAVSLVEVYARLKSAGRGSDFVRVIDLYRQLFRAFMPATESVVFQAVELRNAATSRLPSIDSIIAATAASHGATLVHRDAHFLTIPENNLKQQYLESEE